MTIHELTISTEYVPDWGIWEGVREFVQNALDANDRGHRLTMTHTGTCLELKNEGADIEFKSLLLGQTDKRGVSGMRGEKGEGMDLGMLALTRAGILMTIRTKKEVWTPTLKHSAKWGCPILSVQVQKKKKEEIGVCVRIYISGDQWDELKRNFRIDSPDQEDTAKGYSGTILLNPAEKGRLYSKGIWVQTRSDLSYGYDLINATLDRDRKVIQEFDLKWTIGIMYSEAVRNFPEKMTRKLWLLVQENAADVSGFNEYNGRGAAEAMLTCFKEKHGEDAALVESVADIQLAAHHGIKGVYATTAMKVLLSGKVRSAQSMSFDLQAVDRFLVTDDLSPEEKDSFFYAGMTIDGVADFFRGREEKAAEYGIVPAVCSISGRYSSCINIAEFKDRRILGTEKGGKITIGRVALLSRGLALRVLVHEVAHKETGAGDGHAAHIDMVESLWLAIFAMETKGFPLQRPSNQLIYS